MFKTESGNVQNNKPFRCTSLVLTEWPELMQMCCSSMNLRLRLQGLPWTTASAQRTNQLIAFVVFVLRLPLLIAVVFVFFCFDLRKKRV